jgi:GAF domain-containing protein
VEAVRREIHEIGDDVDAVLQLVTERALTLTGASGAALAFLTEGTMICRARAGEPAPPLGTPVNVKEGLSGECVRSDLLVSCEDTENDPRVDPEVCRTLGIGSMMAAPIVSYLRVVGLLEVFSPHPRGFAKVHEAVLDRLVEIIPKAYRENTQSESASPEPEVRDQVSQRILEQIASAQVPELPEPAPKVRSSLLNLALLGLAGAVAAMALGYLVSPMIGRRGAPSAQASQQPLVEAASTSSGQSATTQHSIAQPPRPKSLAELRKLADQGDAEAQWQMGVRFHNAEGVPHDDAQAMQWFQRAAEQGHVTAQSALGAYYFAARGVPKDLSKAYFWSVIAMAQGDEISKGRLELLASQMTHAQVYAARQQAEAWIHQHSSPKSAGN